MIHNSCFMPVAKYPDAIIPTRATFESVGYDMFCAEDTVIEPHSIKLVSTGVKCYLWPDEWLMLASRSSTPLKKGLMLINGIGVIESDYADNPDNEGEIMAQLYNFTDEPITIPKGDRLVQGVIMHRYVLDMDKHEQAWRMGGFGSTK